MILKKKKNKRKKRKLENKIKFKCARSSSRSQHEQRRAQVCWTADKTDKTLLYHHSLTLRVG